MATPELRHAITFGGNTYHYIPNQPILICRSHQPGSIDLMYELNLETGEKFATNQGFGRWKITPEDPHLAKLRSICQQLDTIRV